MSSGVISEPPPMPVSPTRIPTPSPKTMTSGSMPSRCVEAALDLAGAGPAAFAAFARLCARDAADRAVAPVVQLVVGEAAPEDPPPDVLLGQRRERRDLEQPVLVVP